VVELDFHSGKLNLFKRLSKSNSICLIKTDKIDPVECRRLLQERGTLTYGNPTSVE